MRPDVGREARAGHERWREKRKFTLLHVGANHVGEGAILYTKLFLLFKWHPAVTAVLWDFNKETSSWAMSAHDCKV